MTLSPHVTGSIVLVWFVAMAGGARADHERTMLSLDTNLEEVRGWTIGINQNFNGCWMKATYQDQTTVWMGFGGDDGDAYLALTNPKWQSINGGQQYSLSLRARRQGNWNGKFVGVELGGQKGVFSGVLKKEFVFDMAKAGGISIALGSQTVAQLSLAGSAAGLSSALNCHKAWLEARAGDGGSREGGPGNAPVARRAPEKKEKGSSSGTGFFVTSKGYVMTNNHVIDECSDIQITPAGSTPVRASVIAKDEENDLALLRTTHQPDAIAILMPKVRIGESIYVYGFPLPGLVASSGNFTIGNITATAGLRDDTRMVQISAPVQPGNSGGPLVDQYGNTVGVIVSKLNVLKVAQATNDFPQNVNFAIKASIALNFLEANGVTVSTTPKSTARDPATIAEEAKMFTVKVNCQ